ncbi:MAG: hypothetical protein J6N55_11230 [Anaerovibrio sp.]|uniref:Uncharacterized protein n=2 Tax=Anaerovibrio lipolyticus TaxID=82374 RepID=A0A0B2K0U1_9FIRM|nr:MULTISPECIES: hypothetical protein [Anaerovibrio]KHM52451.1 hypothetical protein NZ47_04835 [Anaerovibrio lipolyticus]MBO5589154.1 hypothetical protein [Anaerovibrio sp.]MBO6246832.1 hypothetical protein [Anaerovibrio sp.]SHI54483.1 hypothetical protein SAMN02745671_00934 [Anaerovibrio lipolyticus DSM 3074]
MLNKNYMAGNAHLSSEAAEPFEVRIKRDKPELAQGVDKLLELVPEEIYKRAFKNIQTFNKRGDTLLIVSGGILERTFLERDCIPALKEAFGVTKVQIIG